MELRRADSVPKHQATHFYSIAMGGFSSAEASRNFADMSVTTAAHAQLSRSLMGMPLRKLPRPCSVAP
jgi:hypothetical protein